MDLVDNAGTITAYVGGSPANVALGLGRLGIPTELLTWLANDSHGTTIATHLHQSGVHVRPESFQAHHTSTALARLKLDGSAAYTFDVTWDIPPYTPSGPLSAVHVGSTGAFTAPGAEKVAPLLNRITAPTLSFDPNICTALMPPHAEATATVERICASATVVKMSDEDLSWLWPSLTPSEATQRMITLGASTVAITFGKRGATLTGHTGTVNIPAAPVNVIDTIGAGDTFMASLIASAVAHGSSPITTQTLTEFGQAATHAAAITVSQQGADLPWAHELDPEYLDTRG